MRGISSVVERLLSKQNVSGSNPLSRSHPQLFEEILSERLTQNPIINKTVGVMGLLVCPVK